MFEFFLILKPSVKHIMVFATFLKLEVPFLFFLDDLRITQLILNVSILHVRNFPTINHSLVKEVILRLTSEIFEGKTTTRWVLFLRIHLESRHLEVFIIIADLMISIKDGGLIGIEEVILICCGLRLIS
jgi:hypothetical protein